MGAAAEWTERALGLMEEADKLRAQARALLEPLYRAQGWKGPADALSVICSGASIMSAAELPAAHAHRRTALTRIACEIDAQVREGRHDG
jgi:hypothetical protein